MRYPLLSSSPMSLKVIDSSLERLSNNKRLSYSYRSFHYFSFRTKGSISSAYWGKKDYSEAKWIRVDRLMVVNLGSKTYFLKYFVSYVSRNIFLD